jgi:hypothetical protein
VKRFEGELRGDAEQVLLLLEHEDEAMGLPSHSMRSVADAAANRRGIPVHQLIMDAVRAALVHDGAGDLGRAAKGRTASAGGVV